MKIIFKLGDINDQKYDDIGGKIMINNYKSIINKNGKSYLNNIYLGKNNDIIDMNYHYINNEILENNLLKIIESKI